MQRDIGRLAQYTVEMGGTIDLLETDGNKSDPVANTYTPELSAPPLMVPPMKPGASK